MQGASKETEMHIERKFGQLCDKVICVIGREENSGTFKNDKDSAATEGAGLSY